MIYFTFPMPHIIAKLSKANTSDGYLKDCRADDKECKKPDKEAEKECELWNEDCPYPVQVDAVTGHNAYGAGEGNSCHGEEISIGYQVPN